MLDLIGSHVLLLFLLLCLSVSGFMCVYVCAGAFDPYSLRDRVTTPPILLGGKAHALLSQQPARHFHSGKQAGGSAYLLDLIDDVDVDVAAAAFLSCARKL